MKKLFGTLLIAAAVAISACDNSANEEAKKKAMEDSIAQAKQKAADDSAKMAAEKAAAAVKVDSTKIKDSLAKLAKDPKAAGKDAKAGEVKKDAKATEAPKTEAKKDAKAAEAPKTEAKKDAKPAEKK